MYDYAKQKLWEAVSSLVGASSIQERLTSAAIPLLALRPPQEVPPDIKERLESVLAKLTAEPLSNETRSTPRKLSDDEGRKIADEILSMFTRVMGGL